MALLMFNNSESLENYILVVVLTFDLKIKRHSTDMAFFYRVVSFQLLYLPGNSQTTIHVCHYIKTRKSIMQNFVKNYSCATN